MDFKREYQPWACAATEESRPILNYCYVTKYKDHDVIVAADGFTLSVVPCDLGPNDVLGLVLAAHLEKAAKETPKRFPVVHVNLLETEISFVDESRRPRFPPDSGISLATMFPDFTQIIPSYGKRFGVVSSSFWFDPCRMMQVSLAMGFDKKRHQPAFRLSRTQYLDSKNRCKDSVALVESCDPDVDGLPVPPFAAIMPMNIETAVYQRYELDMHAWLNGDMTVEVPETPWASWEFRQRKTVPIRHGLAGHEVRQEVEDA